MLLKNLYHYFLIVRSGLFDREFYLKNNPDVRAVDADPILHYIKWGWKENRDPSSNFDTSWYLETYEDIKNAGINPLIHFIKLGQSEGRIPNPTGKEKDKKSNDVINKDLSLNNPLAQQLKIQSESKSYGKKSRSNQAYIDESLLDIDKLIDKINKNRLFDKYMITISHDNYLKEVGGVQVKLLDRITQFKQNQMGDFHIYPTQRLFSLNHGDSPFFIDLLMDGNYIGTINSNDFVDIFSSQKIEISQIEIHHTMGFKMDFIIELLQHFESHTKLFWAHDFFSICPNYFLMRNDREYCNAPDVDSNACRICLYGELRHKHTNEFKHLFDSINMHVITPSEFALDFWKEKSGLKAEQYSVVPHTVLNWKEQNIPIISQKPIKIAYVGHPIYQKGWHTFKKLTETQNNNPDYRFFQFSNIEQKGNFEFIEIAVTKSNRFLMKEELSHHQIDIAILWSLCPETFSFTLYESLAAGCYIITNPYSGNIQNFLIDNPQRGLIAENEEALIQLFSSGKIIEAVKNYQNNGRPTADFVINNEKIV